MKPKEKAEHLVNTFRDMGISFVKSKKCARICINEILEKASINNFYYKEVKEEISNVEY